MKKSEDRSSDRGAVNSGVGVAEDRPTTVVCGSSAPDPEPKEHTRSIKKRRLCEPEIENPVINHDQERNMVLVPESASFARLHFDILEIILEQTGYPGDVVAVSKTCKALHNTLKGPSASGLWRRMRNAIGIPDPSDFVEIIEDSREEFRIERFVGKEADYAAFVFSEGDCEVCGSATQRMFSSFALRLRLCGNNDCRDEMRTKFEFCAIDECAPWVKFTPTLETPHIIDPWGATRYWPRCQRVTRKEWIRERSLDAEEQTKLAARTKVWMKFCVALCKWRDSWHEGVQRVKKRNDILARNFARKEGWVYIEMVSDTSYGRFHNMKPNRHEEITEKDLEEMRPLIAHELHESRERKDRKKVMRLRETNKKDIWKYYQKLMSQPANYPLLPPFTLFLELPSTKLLQSSDLMDAKIEVRTAVRGRGFLGKMIKEEVESWVETAKRQMLATIGGSTEWNHMVAARRMPHPVLRPNARWKCKLCNSVEPKYENDGCLDFAGVCRHQCKEKTKKKRADAGSADWDVNNFVQDEQACSALTTCLKYIEGAIEEPSETRKRIQRNPWRCISCNPPMFVSGENIAGHSHRHPVPMQIQIMERNVYFLLNPPTNPLGVSQWLKQSSQDAKPFVEKMNYGCLYCHQTKEKSVSREGEGKAHNNDSCVPKTSETTSSADVDMKDGDAESAGGSETKEGSEPAAIDTGTLKKKKTFENRFNFNGLRSHLSSKHKIYQIRDEDFWCYQPIDKFKDNNPIIHATDWQIDWGAVLIDYNEN